MSGIIRCDKMQMFKSLFKYGETNQILRSKAANERFHSAFRLYRCEQSRKCMKAIKERYKPNMEDEMIINLFYERSEQAINELSAKYGKLAQGICANILKNLSDAEECVNDSLFTAWNSIPPTRPSSLKAYFVSVARNKALDKYRYNTSGKRDSLGNEPLDELAECLISETSVEADCEADELAAAVNAFLGTQKKTDRQMFVCRYYLSDSVQDIAERLNMKPPVVSLRLHRMRDRLRKYLEKENLI